MKFNEKLIKLRKQKNLTQQALAEKINYSDKVISKWENGHSIPDMQAMSVLSKFYDLTIDELMNDYDISVKEEKSFPTLPKILFHILLLFVPIIIISSILGYFNPNANITIIPTWDAVVPCVLGILLIVLNLIDLIFTHLNLSRKIVVCLIFALICVLFVFAIIAFGMYGDFTYFTKPFIYLCVSAVVNTAYGFLINKKC
ncbi:MAG: helix-turn-helix transcriptional regulator [Clostridia bacterium]|nr:helix-turn-helix transcriptional regulator [Clostridia bacterium]